LIDAIWIVGLSPGMTDLPVLRQPADRPFAKTKGQEIRISNTSTCSVQVSINRILNLEVAYASLCFESFSCLFLNISNNRPFAETKGHIKTLSIIK
jgi:hypothetical protein